MINAATSLPYKGRLRKSRRNGRDSKCGDHDDYTVAVGVRISIFEILICTKAFQSLQCRENYIYFGGHMQPVQYRACKIVLRFLPTIFRSFGLSNVTVMRMDGRWDPRIRISNRDFRAFSSQVVMHLGLASYEVCIRTRQAPSEALQFYLVPRSGGIVLFRALFRLGLSMS